MKSPPNMFIAKKSDGHPTDQADLFGKRLVVAIETEEGKRLNETMIKELTGGDRIRARRMREDFWEFAPTHTLIMATNHKPLVRGRDKGIWRRLKLVPFTVSAEGTNADLKMPEKLRAEFPGILAWCLRGCLNWQTHGMKEPEDIAEATLHYKAEQDTLGTFFEEHTTIAPQCRVKAGDLYGRYRSWAEARNERVMTQTEFGTAIEERGIEKKKSGTIWYLGIGLLQIDETDSWTQGQ
jgi:putative DNA primase/helicase